MFNRQLVILAVSAVVMFGALTPNAQAGHKGKKIIEAIALGIAASALAATAAGAANAHRDRNTYRYHQGVGKRENAVAACIHRADRVVQNAGGLYVRVDKIKRADHIGKSKYKVIAKMTGVYPWGHKKSRVVCVVKRGHVSAFSYN